ncbi:Tfp pilus assembly protein FimT/FimU [Aquabacterium sp.]|uniref:Tfp pilus assembly protein FimT/FimU n=1 Tax=Aquabacterium sp. TaxID=1872578 RepID=UPI003783D9D4
MMVPAAPARRRHGLTLIELMIGLAILAVLTSLAAPPFASWLARNRVKSAAANLVADLGEARHESSRRGAPMYVLFQAGAQWCYAITLDPQAGCASASSAVLKRVQASDLPGISVAEAETFAFDGQSGTGLQALSRVRLVSRQGDALQVKMTRLGRASICAPDGGFVDVPHC